MNLILTAKQISRMKRALVATASLLVLALAAILAPMVGCSSERETASAAPETVSNVALLSAQPANIPDLVDAVGTLRAAQTSQLASQMMGNIVEIRVHEGDRIQRGQVLGQRGEIDAALRDIEQALSIVRLSGYRLALSTALLHRAQLRQHLGRVDPGARCGDHIHQGLGVACRERGKHLVLGPLPL